MGCSQSVLARGMGRPVVALRGGDLGDHDITSSSEEAIELVFSVW